MLQKCDISCCGTDKYVDHVNIHKRKWYRLGKDDKDKMVLFKNAKFLLGESYTKNLCVQSPCGWIQSM